MEEQPKGGGKPIRCRAAICRRAGEPLQIEEIEVAPPKSWEVRIKIICTSLCHSDVTFWKIDVPPAIFPRILGHEAVGIVESVGENVKEVKEGDTVIPTLVTECQDCRDCNSKKSNKCSTFPFKVSPSLLRDGTTRFTDSKGEVIYHFIQVSSFSEYTVVDIANITKIDPSIPPNRACVLGCGISTDESEVCVYDSVLVDAVVFDFLFYGFLQTTLGCDRIVESVGENVKEVKEGDTVIPTLVTECQDCRDCNSKKSNKCSAFPFKVSPSLLRDGTTRFTDSKGEVIYHFIQVSSFSEYTVVDIANITKIDPSIPPNRACVLGCGISTGVGAAWKTANVEAGSTVAIFGLGAIGFAVAEGARLRGATKIIGVDLNPNKFEIGKKFGVTDFVNPVDCGDKPIHEVIAEMTDGGADYCFECVGSASVVNQAYASCRKGWGKTIVLGLDKPGSQLTFDSFEFLLTGKIIMGSFFGDIKPKTDIPLLVKSYLDKELRLDDFVTHEVQFEDINKAFDLLLSGKSIRSVIWMDKKSPPV